MRCDCWWVRSIAAVETGRAWRRNPTLLNLAPVPSGEPVRLSRCLGESTDALSVLLLRESATGLQCAAPFRRYLRQCSGQGSLLRRFTDGDHVIATGNHVRILHLPIGGQKAFAGGVQSGGAL